MELGNVCLFEHKQNFLYGLFLMQFYVCWWSVFQPDCSYIWNLYYLSNKLAINYYCCAAAKTTCINVCSMKICTLNNFLCMFLPLIFLFTEFRSSQIKIISAGYPNKIWAFEILIFTTKLTIFSLQSFLNDMARLSNYYNIIFISSDHFRDAYHKVYWLICHKSI